VAADLVEVAEDILAAQGKEMSIEAVLPGAHLLVPPTDLVDSILTAVQMLDTAKDLEDPAFAPWRQLQASAPISSTRWPGWTSRALSMPATMLGPEAQLR